jgi:flavin-dependent dehydrogenase
MNGAAELALDALVVGGGPAGSACAIRLARGGARVGLLEATDFSRFRIGETIGPAIRPLLSELGIADSDESPWSAPCSGLAAAWGQAEPLQQPSLFNPYGRGICIDRRGFDRMLFERARDAGAVAFTRCRLATTVEKSSHWTFSLRTPQTTVHGRTTWLVAATGRTVNAPLAPSQSRRWLDRLVAIAAVRIDGEELSRACSRAALVEATPNGWWYSTTLPDGRALWVFFTDMDLLPSGKRAVDRFLAEQIDAAGLTRARYELASTGSRHSSWKGFDARSSIRRIVLARRWVAIGDAAMAFDPLRGRGVIDALQSGIEVADWLLWHPHGRDDGEVPGWATTAADRFNDYYRDLSAIYGRETRWSGSIFWQRRLELSRGVPDQPAPAGRSARGQPQRYSTVDLLR